jgi:hypothetical protein
MILPRQKEEEVKPKCIAPILGATIPIHEIQVLVFSKIKKKLFVALIIWMMEQ